VGYFARIAPEKGLHHLVEAFRLLHRELPDARLRVGGCLAESQRGYFSDIQKRAEPFRDRFEYVGSPETHVEKVQFLRSVDVLSVPTEFLEPKGLYVLEALANGVPVVQPAHGAFPELIEATGGGRLVPPGDPAALAHALRELAESPADRTALGQSGWDSVRSRFHSGALAAATIETITPSLVPPSRPQSGSLALSAPER
jgi:glycosyltransferase involved in cell wall biosynthesis